MKIKEIYLWIASFCVFIVCSILFTLNLYYSVIITYQFYTFIRLINNVGNTFALFDYFLFYACLDTLLMPIFGYEVYNQSSKVATIWGKTMAVDKETYFNYLIPCNLIMFIVITTLLPKLNYDKIATLLKLELKDKGRLGITFIFAGIFFTIFQNQIPPVLMVLSGVLKSLQFIGPIYILFSNMPFKNYIFYGSLLFMALGAISTGMFGDFLNTAALIVIVLLPLFKDRFNFSFATKTAFFSFALFMVLVLQSIKPIFRQITWKEKSVEGYSLETSSSSAIFRSLMWDRMTNPSKIFDEETLFGPYVRFNQGVIIAKAMAYIPNKAPYLNGSQLSRVLVSILVPRLFYPDKYESGGVENMLLFLGYRLRGFSMNVGPFGEMYGNFGPNLGLIFIGLLALVLVGTWRLVINMSKKNIIWILWISNLYYYTLTVETDIFTMLNSFSKNFLLIYIFLKLLERVTQNSKKSVIHSA